MDEIAVPGLLGRHAVSTVSSAAAVQIHCSFESAALCPVAAHHSEKVSVTATIVIPMPARPSALPGRQHELIEGQLPRATATTIHQPHRLRVRLAGRYRVVYRGMYGPAVSVG